MKLKRLTVYAIPSRQHTKLLTQTNEHGIHFHLGRMVTLLRPPYNSPVARGWESKSVELQQEDATLTTAEPKRDLTPQQRGIESRKQGLKLSRSRILEQLHSVENPRYRKILEQALAELDQQIMQLS